MSQVESEKWFIMSIFMQVPQLVVKRLHREAEKGAARMRAQLDSEDAAGSDHEEDEVCAVCCLTMVSRLLPHVAYADQKHFTVTWQALFK